MKVTSALCAAALLSTTAYAFPAIQAEALAAAARREAFAAKRSQYSEWNTQQQNLRKRAVPFDPTTQYINVTKGSGHEFVAPDFTKGDQRGPCPGLNALANHNFLPHSGVAEMGTIISAVNSVYGMSLDLGGFLAVFGTVFDGNPFATNPGYSIGGPTPLSANILGNVAGLVGAPQGLSGSHNKYESDSSPTRGDIYVVGDDYKVQVKQFQQYYDALREDVGGADQQYDHLFDFRIARFNDSIANNPYFFFSPFAGVLVAPAGYNFPVRMMSNKSEEYPEGKLSKADLMSFFAITGTSGKFTYNFGHEKIPDNWYKRAIGDEYTIAGFLLDVLNYAEKDPRLLSIGGNQGKGNSFALVNITALTKGTYNDAQLLQGNNLECFLFQSAQAAVPDVAGNPESNDQVGQHLISDTIIQTLTGAGCPVLYGIDKHQYDKYPGYQKHPVT